MKRLAVGLLLCAGTAWADQHSARVVTRRPVDVAALTQELQAAGLSIASVADEAGQEIVVLKPDGAPPFTAQETSAIVSAVQAHDPTIAEKRRQQQRQERAQALARIRVKLGLSPAEFDDLREALRD